VAQTISVGWAADPVHPNKHIYAKAALNLMEKMANNKPAAKSGGLPPSRKRTWSTSNESGGQGPSGRSGGNGGGDGGRGAGNSGSYGGHTGGGGSRKSSRSQQWQEMRRWNAPGYQRNDGFQHDSREYGGGGGVAGPVAVTVMARHRTPGSTAAGTTAGITAVTTADTIRLPLKEGMV
jgi:hypothetical protein